MSWARAHGPAAHGTSLLLMAVPCLLPVPGVGTVLALLASSYAMAERFARARLSHLATAHRRSWISGAIGLMALIVVMPIPFGNVLPALALMLIGLGLVFRDGVAVVLGLVMAGLAMCATAGLMLVAWAWGSEWIVGWLSV